MEASGADVGAAVYNGPEPRRGQRPDPRRKVFLRTLEACEGNLSRAAGQLGVSRKTASVWWRLHKEGRLT